MRWMPTPSIAALALFFGVAVVAGAQLYSESERTVATGENESAVRGEREAHEAAPAAASPFEEYVATYTGVVEDHDPRAALTLLRGQIEEDPALLRACHGVVHEIGHAAYEKYGSFGGAMEYQDEICNSGYLHGVIESHFSDAADIEAAMETTCAGYRPGSFIHWECIHGIGHGLMFFTENDLPRALELCDTYPSRFERSTCANGVFMENFLVDQVTHSSKYVDEENWLYPCAKQDAVHKPDCYIYAPTYYLHRNEDDYAGALELCESAEREYRSTCAHGVGSQMIKEHIFEPKFVEGVCMHETERTEPCIRGMVGLYINHFGGLAEAKALCPTLEAGNRAVCEEVVDSRSILFRSS